MNIRTISKAIAPSIAAMAFAAALVLPATGVAKSSALTCNGSTAKVTNLRAIKTTCPDAVAVAKAFGKRGSSGCIQMKGAKQIDRCKVRRYNCVGHWKIVTNPSDPKHRYVQYNTSCTNAKKKVSFNLLTRAS